MYCVPGFYLPGIFLHLHHAFTLLASNVYLLPIIKLIMRNVLAKTAAHLRDETPEIVVFNAELFSSLFLSYCMQRSPSLWTTTLLMLADVVLVIASVRDIYAVYRGVKFSEPAVEHELNSTGIRVLRSGQTEGRLSILHQANSILIKRKRTIKSNGVCPLPKDMAAIAPAQFDHLHKKITVVIRLKKLAQKKSYSNLVATPKRTSRRRNTSAQGPATLAYTRKVQRLLYMAEYLVLLNYIEVIIPLIFSIYLVITYNLPNRDFYAVFEGMEYHQLIQTLRNVMLYCFLQFVTAQGPATLAYTRKVQRLLYMAEYLVLLNYIEVIIPLIFSIYLVITYNLPNRDFYAVFEGMEYHQLIQTLRNVMLYCFLQFVSAKIGLSLTRQLAFVLEKQFDWIQTSLVFWVLYNSQSSLVHVGYDYSFQFAWLHTHSSPVSNVTATS
ncbi:Hypothetical protein PHPALM_15221 [Phytophthora palmivora]|uniref:Transmembrane protein n=1 Tax=Phytophthora palmivora TaxID=4796 RepID=A0A2P4XSR6_9STRA|nr:Hypothetical protein PHPALM_15221 [Phytophthora palmivora]